VLLEKPLEVDTARAEELVEACRACGVRLGIVLQHRLRPSAVAMVERVRRGDADIVLGTRFGANATAHDIPRLKRVMLKLAVATSPRGRRLGLTDAHNGLRAFNRTVADALNLTSNGMAHASEFVALIDDAGWRVVEQPVDITYTDYSKAKGQSLLNGVNILFDSAIRRR